MHDRKFNMNDATTADADMDVRDLLGTGLLGSRIVGAAKAATAMHMCLLAEAEEQGCSSTEDSDVPGGHVEVRS